MSWRPASALALALAACRPAPVPTDTLRLAIINDPILNPVLAPDLGSIMVNKVLFPGLVRPNDSLEPEPDLAERWEISPDGRTYLFHLRPGLRWHDGHPLTAQDVVFTFGQVQDSASGTLLWSDFSALDSVVAIDSLTVRFTLRAPFAPLLTLLGHNAGIIPEHVFAGRKLRDAVEFNRSRPVGSGPYRIAEAVPGSHLTLEANPSYHGPRPAIARLVFRIVPDLVSQVAQFRARELDLIVVEPANLAAVEGRDGVAVDLIEVPQHYFVGFNQHLPMFRPAEVRRALTLAVNRQAIIEGVLRGHGDYPRGTIPAALRRFYASELPPVPYDTGLALSLLRRAGWSRDAGGPLRDQAGEPFGFTLLVDKGNPTREQTAIAVAHDLRAIGIDVRIQTLEFSSLVRDRILPHRYEAVLIWWNTPLDPDQYSYYGAGQANNDIGYANPAADSLLLAGRHATDPGIRAKAYLELQRLEVDDPPVLVLYYPREIRVRRTTLAGLPALGIRDALRHVERFHFTAP